MLTRFSNTKSGVWTGARRSRCLANACRLTAGGAGQTKDVSVYVKVEVGTVLENCISREIEEFDELGHQHSQCSSGCSRSNGCRNVKVGAAEACSRWAKCFEHCQSQIHSFTVDCANVEVVCICKIGWV